MSKEEKFDYAAFSEIFPPDAVSDFEFEDNVLTDYIAPAEGFPMPEFSPGFETDLAKEDIFHDVPSSEPITNSGIYRSSDGSSEFCSFEDDIAAPEGWEYEAFPDNTLDAPQKDIQEVEEYQIYDASDMDFSNQPDMEQDDIDDENSEEDEEHRGPKHPLLNALGNMFLGFLTFLSILYLVGLYSDNAVITKTRNMYIQTAMSTLNHKYLATAIIPPDIIRDLMRLNYEAENSMFGVQSNWGDVVIQSLPSFENATTDLMGTIVQDEDAETQDSDLIIESDTLLVQLYESPEEQTFFDLFYEIDYTSMQDYVDAHPEVIQNGWENININAAGLNDSGTDIKTVYGDQVLAVNAKEGVLLIRININLSRGVMAICKDSSKLNLCAASTLGSTGQTVGRICENNNGIVAVTASAFIDPNGEGNGGQISGLAVCNGRSYGYSLGGGYKRLELRENNQMYIVDSSSSLTEGTTDAAEFTPALIIDGSIVVDENSGWASPNPRVCIGQTAYLETVMVAVEGRLADSPGCSVIPVAEKMQQYGCVQAMNMDGGTSAMMYYNGQSIIRCSNQNLQNGRTVPTAWVYKRNS